MVARKNIAQVMLSALLMAQGSWAQVPPGQPPQPPSGPSREAIEQARNAGQQDGRVEGEMVGRREGEAAGRTEGERAGFREGFDRCEREMRQREQDRGFRDGFQNGEYKGDREGRDAGDREGDRRGEAEGTKDGTDRANNDARHAATGPGRDRGFQEASQSDASAVGQREGIATADRDARAEAERTDYPRGRETVRRERWQEPIGREDDFKQKSAVAPQSTAVTSAVQAKLNSLAAMSKMGVVSPMGRSYPTPEEQQAYDQGYRQGYQDGFNSGRRSGYDHAFENARRGSIDRGCREAQSRDYRSDYARGYDNGERDGYRRAYDIAYDRAYRSAYDSAFRSASNTAYSRSYDGFYKQHFESARAAAYRERYDELYQAAYQPAYTQKYNQVYPGYADLAYKRGRADETQEFVDRPVRFVDGGATETILNGLFEPGEALRTKMVVRNFSAAKIDGARVKINLVSLDSTAATMSEATSSLVKGLESKSQTTIREALEFYMNESALNQNKHFRLELSINGKLSDSRDFVVQTKFMANLLMVGVPELKEGLKTTISIKVKNQSQVATEPNFQVELKSRPEILELLDARQTVGLLAAGEERQLSFNVILRSHAEQVSLPLALEATNGTRRVGSFTTEPSIPASNEYRIDLLSGLDLLQKSGVARLEYQITNVSSRLLMNSLQLSAKVLGPDTESFIVVGPNPQLLAPMISGQKATFVIPVLVKQDGRRGTVELEIKENGRTTMIHRKEF